MCLNEISPRWFHFVFVTGLLESYETFDLKMNGIRAGIRDTRQKIKIWIQGTTQSPSSILPRPRARCGWIASTFFSAPFLSWGDILKKVKRGILGKVWQVWWTDVSHLSSDLRNVETFQILFPVPPGWEKNPLWQTTNQLTAAEIHSRVGFQPGRVLVASESRQCSYSSRVFLNFWRFCI